MPHHKPHETRAKQLLQEYLNHVIAASQVVDHKTITRDDVEQAQQRLAYHQAYLIDLIAAGLKSGDVLF